MKKPTKKALMRKQMQTLDRHFSPARSTVAALLCACALLAPNGAFAEPAASTDSAAVQLALLNPLQLVDDARSITAMRLSLLHGKNEDVRGFDLSGVATQTEGSFRGGLQIAAVNEVKGDCSGGQLGLMGSFVHGQLRGAQISGLASHAGNGSGMQLGAILVEADHFKGFQLALFTRAKELEGLQLGLLNFNGKGFLPVFPIFNFGR